MGKLLLYSSMLGLVSLIAYGFSFLFWIINLFSPLNFVWQAFNISNFLLLISLIGVFGELIYSYYFARTPRKIRFDPIKNPSFGVGMTAYNDEKAIGIAVKDFRQIKEVKKIIVIDNNCNDMTAEVARKAGAKVIVERVQGFGAACKKALTEALKQGNIVCLVEGDGTFSGQDLKKMLSYIENADMVVGTRTTAELASDDCQITTFMRYGNLFIAKLIQLRYWDRVRLTDVRCTFRIIRPQALHKIMPELTLTGNEFNPHMILVALRHNLKIVEVPITFRKRIGESKGVGSNMIKGLITGFYMWFEILIH